MKEFFYLVDSFKPIAVYDIDDIEYVKCMFCTDNVFKINEKQFNNIFNLYTEYIVKICNILNSSKEK